MRLADEINRRLVRRRFRSRYRYRRQFVGNTGDCGDNHNGCARSDYGYGSSDARNGTGTTGSSWSCIEN